MGTNKTRNSAPSGANKNRANLDYDYYTWNEMPNAWNAYTEAWEDQHTGEYEFDVDGTAKVRQSAPSGANKTRN